MSANPTKRTGEATVGIVIALGLAAVLVLPAPARAIVDKITRDLTPLNSPADDFAFDVAQQKSKADRDAFPNGRRIRKPIQ